MIDASDLVFDGKGQAPERPSETRLVTLKAVEAEMIEKALREEGGRVGDAAARLGMPRSTLYTKIKLLRIKVAR